MIKFLGLIAIEREYSSSILQNLTHKLQGMSNITNEARHEESMLVSVFSNGHFDHSNEDSIRILWGIYRSEQCDDVISPSSGSDFGIQIIKNHPEILLLDYHHSRFQMVRGHYSMIPCYYMLEGNQLFFSSEKKALWKISDKKIESLQPGERIHLTKEKGFQKERAVQRKKPALVKSRSYDETISLLGKLLKKSFRTIHPKQRVGVMLSGGVDSSLAAFITKEHGEDVIAISTSAENARDLDASKSAANVLEIDQEIVHFDLKRIWNILPRVIHAIETSNRLDVEIAIPFYLVAERAAELEIPLLISGQGPDELFAGYAKHERFVSEGYLMDLPEQLWQEVSITHEANIERDQKVIGYYDVGSFFPFLYPPFVEESLKVPPEWKVDLKRVPPRKIIFRDLARVMGLPDQLASRPKKATQFSSGSHKLLLKVIKKNIRDKSITNREVQQNMQLFLDHIAERVGIRTSINESDVGGVEWIPSMIDQLDLATRDNW
ncbi:MAG: hypothetical protein GF411_13455 [Candidatus Lokiarchaeota archaeon]|nr:hypothetical protein [Candidatus Lokiarchaeota archaeon]